MPGHADAASQPPPDTDVSLDDLPAATAANDGPAADARRPRVPPVGPGLRETGTPSFHAWASCLTLGDLEAALRKAVA